MTEVTWLPVSGAAIYEVSSDGRVRSIDRTVHPQGWKRSFFRRGRELKLQMHTNGYLGGRYVADDGAATFQVHGLVCKNFHGDKPTPDHQVRHLNGNRLDNRAENLTWGTPKENVADILKHGNNPYRNRTHCRNGHEFNETNTHVTPKGHRVCRTCSAASKRRRAAAARKRAAV